MRSAGFVFASGVSIWNRLIESHVFGNYHFLRFVNNYLERISTINAYKNPDFGSLSEFSVLFLLWDTHEYLTHERTEMRSIWLPLIYGFKGVFCSLLFIVRK